MDGGLWAIGFGDPAKLWFLAAAAIPLALHLWRRPVRHREPFAAIEFLAAAWQRRSRWLRPLQWAILALRVVAVCLIALAAAEPFAGPRAAPSGARPPMHHIVVIDISYSMDYRGEQGRRFDQAIASVRGLIARGESGDRYSLIAGAAVPRLLTDEPTGNVADLNASLDRLEISHGAFDLVRTLDVVEQLLGREKDTNQASASSVTFVTDLQGNSWSDRTGDPSGATLERRFAAIGRRASVQVIDVAGAELTADNSAVAAIQWDEPVTADRPTSIRAMVKHFGRGERNGVDLELWSEGRLLARRTITLAPDSETTVTFDAGFEGSGDRLIEVRLTPDRLSLDDRRVAIVPIRDRLRVLCVEGRPDLPERRRGAGFLATALAPLPRHETFLPQIDVRLSDETALTELDLEQFDCVLLSAVSRFSQTEAERLARYIRRGGSAVIFAGEGSVAENYNRRLGDSGEQVLPMELGEVREQPPQGIDPMGYRHPIVAAFSGKGRSALLTTPLEKSFELIPARSVASEVVAAHGDGRALMAAAVVGRGRIVLVGTAPDLAWGGLPLWPSFVPLVHEVVNYCVAGRSQRRNASVGESLEGEIPRGEERLPRLIGPNAKLYDVRFAPDDARRWRSEAVRLSGVYFARFSETDEPQRFAVGLDVRESDLSRAASSQLARLLGEAAVSAEIESGGRGAGIGIGSPEGSLAAGALLLVAVLAAMLEAMLTWRSGRSTA